MEGFILACGFRDVCHGGEGRRQERSDPNGLERQCHQLETKCSNKRPVEDISHSRRGSVDVLMAADVLKSLEGHRRQGDCCV